MSERLVDDLDTLETEVPNNNLVKILVFFLIVFSIFMSIVGGKVIHLWIVQFYEFRHRYPDLVNTNLIIGALSISIVPLITYLIWINLSKFNTWKSYLFLLLVAIILFVGFFVLGLELILKTAVDYRKENPLLPSYILIPRFPFSFDLLFMLSAAMSFLTLKLMFRKKRGESIHTNNK